MEEEGGAAGVRSEAMDIIKPTGDLRDFLKDALSSLEKLESQWTLESEVQDSYHTSVSKRSVEHPLNWSVEGTLSQPLCGLSRLAGRWYDGGEL